MFDQNGLSLDQAPPFTVVLRFFAMGAVFGIAAGVLMLGEGSVVFDPTSPYGKVMTHILTLGVMLSFMLGALFQMLPVIAGVVLQSPLRLAAIVQVPMVFGIVLLLWGFGTGDAWAFVTAGILLGLALLPLIVILLGRLKALQNHSASSRGMTIALTSLFFVVFLGLYLSGTLGGVLTGNGYNTVRMAHFSFGIFGWITLLIVAISFQVVEMFYVTPSHPNWMKKWLGKGIFILVLVAAILQFWLPSVWRFAAYPLMAVLLILYAMTTLKRFTQRKRPLTDATVWFWRLGLISLILSLIGMILMPYVHTVWVNTLVYILFATFALSVLFAMLYKIIPFLTWFHLNSQGYLTAPMMHEVIHPKTAKKHLSLHLLTTLMLIFSAFYPPLTHVAGVGVALSFGWMLYQIFHAASLYRHTRRTGKKFEMPTAE